MLWTVIYDFFVTYIFGGYTSNADYYTAFFGPLYIDGELFDPDLSTFDVAVAVPIGAKETNIIDFSHSMPLGNYLSLIATIISMVAIVILCCLLIKKIYNICAHVIG